MISYPTYFLQSPTWGKFWLQANQEIPGHDLLELEVPEKDYPQKILVYQYPWRFSQKFWYIPRLKIYNQKTKDTLLFKFLVGEAKTRKVAFLKFDLDDSFIQKPDSGFDLNKFCDVLKPIFKLNLKAKSIQFLQTITLDLREIPNLKNQTKIENLNPANLSQFYRESSVFWAKTNQNVRRYTKKSLTQSWQIWVTKTPENFEAFWKIYNQTKERQGFSIQTKEYLKCLFEKDFSRLIVLKDQENKPQAVWFGCVSEKTLTYLYGGNTEYSFKNYGQYLVHLVAIFMATQEGLDFYDLGGYNPKLGFGKFKESYRGQIRTFAGPADIICKPLVYYFFVKIINLGKFLLNVVQKPSRN